MEGPGSIKEVLEERGFKVLERLATEIKGNETFDGLIVMGGPMGVYESDRYPYLNVEMTLIRRAITSGKPVLGVCLGSQLISAALGGSVSRGEFGEELGVYKVYLLEDLREVLGPSIEVFQMHGDTFTLPKGGKLLAYSEKYFQAFRVGTALGLQFHLEVNRKIVSQWIEYYKINRQFDREVDDERLRRSSEKVISYWLSSVS
ncbi:glutamine amidotransferase class-I [Metallosphaera cuprina Ar-4]|uniref:Glutamine amidotransferase class-I n=1 Tax=Metallosphaera cuprina (strain Ar-4) TaxID=1006006 RepID=F4G2D9_METCR|nr:glutamine amidotransferase class-I [Metallosphaera cuprina Ar-4]